MSGKSQRQHDVDVSDDGMDSDGWKMNKKDGKKKETDSERKKQNMKKKLFLEKLRRNGKYCFLYWI
jgi:hypothetical protein